MSMKSRSHIVLCTEANSVVGTGHAVRCAGLLHALPIAYDLTVLGDGPLLQGLFPAAVLRVTHDWTTLDWQELGLPRVDLVLADIPYCRPRDWDRVRCPDAPLVAIDDYGGLVSADVVINGTVLPQYHRYDPARSPGRLCAGPDWALVRPEFAATPWQGTTSTTLIGVVGSGAEARDWALGIAAIGARQFNAKHVRLVVSGAFDAMSQLRDACQLGDIDLHFGVSAAELSQLLATSSAALVTAGMVLYESVTTGVPVVTYPQIADLVGEAAWFAEHGACIDLGLPNSSPQQAARAVNRLIADTAAAQAMSERQHALLDGHGIARAAALLMELLETRQ